MGRLAGSAILLVLSSVVVTHAATSQTHWAFVPPTAPTVPVLDSKWAQTPLDRFVLAKLNDGGLKPADRADKRTLIRRATFDLTGLPPTPSEIEAFLADASPDAFTKLV